MGRSRNDTASDVQNGRHGQPCKSALHAGWVRSCLQDKSGRTNQACDWPTRTCNASGSRADCAAAGYRVKAGLPCERWLECNECVFRVRLALRLSLSLFLSYPSSSLPFLSLFFPFLSIFLITLPSLPFSLLLFTFAFVSFLSLVPLFNFYIINRDRFSNDPLATQTTIIFIILNRL